MCVFVSLTGSLESSNTVRNFTKSTLPINYRKRNSTKFYFQSLHFNKHHPWDIIKKQISFFPDSKERFSPCPWIKSLSSPITFSLTLR